MLLTQTGRWGGWDPFAEMRRLQSDLNRRLDPGRSFAPARGFPAINIWVGDNSVVVTAELPGVSQDDIELAVRDEYLIIQGKREVEADDQVAWYRRERPVGTFSRTVELPYRVDPEKVEARFTDGVLEVEMQRPESERLRKVEIKAS